MYIKKIVKGSLFASIVAEARKEIWELEIKRTYHADLEFYSINTANPKNTEVEILVGIKET